MELLGQQDAFAIEYGFEANPFGESGLYGASWGEFRLWVQGRNICSFSKNSQAQTYKWNLIGIFEWLCKNLEYILNDDPFPVRANGSSASDLIEDSCNYQPEDDNEFDVWVEKKQDWEFRHSWYSARSGSFLARVYFRHVSGNQIEISWDNSSIYSKDTVLFDYPKGVTLVEVYEFRNVVHQFLNDFANKLSHQFPEDNQLYSLLP